MLLDTYTPIFIVNTDILSNERKILQQMIRHNEIAYWVYTCADKKDFCNNFTVIFYFQRCPHESQKWKYCVCVH